MRILDGLARLCFYFDQRRIASALGILLGLSAMSMIAFGRPNSTNQPKFREASINDINFRDVNNYVRVTGVLAPNRTRQVDYRLGNIVVRGSRYIPMFAPGVFDPLYVLDEGLPDSMFNGLPTTLTGIINVGTSSQHPSLYLEVASPPNTQMLSLLAQIGVILLVFVCLFYLIKWWVRKYDYVITSPTKATKPLPTAEVFWFGDLGRAFDGSFARFAPVQISAKAIEAQLNLLAGRKGSFYVIIRRLGYAQLLNVATSLGTLPAARIEFEDERGLRRHGTLAFSSNATRDVVLDVLRYVGQ
jgi:hypothetical protein